MSYHIIFGAADALPLMAVRGRPGLQDSIVVLGLSGKV